MAENNKTEIEKFWENGWQQNESRIKIEESCDKLLEKSNNLEKLILTMNHAINKINKSTRKSNANYIKL